jgi:ornithine cyclodeaminase/alanine dehydrogenase
MVEQSYIYLSDADLAGLGIGTADVIAAIEQTVLDKAEGQVWAAPKSAVIPGDGRYAMATLAGSDRLGVVAVKSVMVCPDNAARGLPGINGAIMLLDSATGILVGLIDANWVTAVRTAGLSAVMAKRLADPAAKSIAFIGTGVQAHSHMRAFADLFPLENIHVFGRGQANIDKLCVAAETMGLEAQAHDTAEASVRDADIVVSSITLSYDVAPFIDANWIKAGAFAAITDLAIPWQDETMGAFETLYVDDKAQEISMEKPMVSANLISGDLDGLVTGRDQAAFDAGKRSAFVFRGLAIGDLAVAGLAYRKMRER